MKNTKDIPTLLEIKSMVKHETSGSKIMPRFYDFMENSDKYMFNLEVCKDDDIQRMVAQLTQKALSIDSEWARFERAIFLENRQDHFFHGQFFMGKHLVSFFYFDDIKIGCMALAPQNGGQMIYMRFDGSFMQDRLN